MPMNETDLIKVERLTHEVRSALQRLPSVELLEVEEGKQLASAMPDDYDPVGLTRHVKLGAEATNEPGTAPYEADIGFMLRGLLAELKRRNISPDRCKPMWFDKLEDMGYIPFRFGDYILVLTASLDTHGGQLGIFLLVHEDLLEDD